MNVTLSRAADRCWSVVCKIMLFALAVCAPLHVVLAQTGASNQMTIVGGGGQSGPAGSELAQPLTVQFSGSSYVYLQWQVTSGDATFEESGSTSYIVNNGSFVVSPGTTSSVHVVLGATQGNVTVTASCIEGCDSSTVLTFSERATAPPPYLQMSIAGGNRQTGAPGATLPQPLSVALTPTTQGYDGPFTVPVTWRVVSGTATFAANHSTVYTQNISITSSQPSSTQGRKELGKKIQAITAAQTYRGNVFLILGNTPGPVSVRASCSDCTAGEQQLFSETIVGTSTGTLEKVSGDLQNGAVGSAAAAPLVVQLPGGAGQTVTWSVASGQATLSSTTTTLDANGEGSITFRYGNAAGPITIQASAGSAGTVTFSETALSASIGSVSIVSGNNQSGTAGTALQPFVLQVGPVGAGAANVVITWAVTQGGGTLQTTSTTTDATGRTTNTLTLGSAAGPNVVQATIPGYGVVTFTTTAIAGIPTGSVFTITSGNNQALIPNQSSEPLIVKLTSSTGQGVAGATIQWAVSGQSGSLDSATTTTDANGQSQNRVKTVLPAAYTVTAQVVDQPQLPILTFSFNNAITNLPSLSTPQQGVAHAIDKACPALAAMSNLNPQQQDFLQRCSEIVVNSGSNPTQVPNALDQMLNNKAQPQAGIADSVMLGQLNNLNVRLAELRQGSSGFSIGGLTMNDDGRSLPMASLGDVFTSYRKDPKESTDEEVGKDFQRWGFFATGLIDRGGASNNGISPGFDFHSASLTAGVDYRFNDAFVGGLALGYASSNSDIDANAGKVDVDSYSLNAYFTWYHNNDFYIEGSAVADWLNYDLGRNIVYQIASLTGGTTTVNQTANASPDGKQYSLSLSIGKDFNSGAWAFSPYVRGIYTHVSLDGFSETIANQTAAGSGLATSVDSRSFSSDLGVLGGRVSRTFSMDWGVLVPNALVEWNHEFKNDPQTVVTRFLADPTQTPIILTDPSADQNYFNLGLGLNAVLPGGKSGFLYYEHVAGFGGLHENRLSAGIRIEF